MVDLEFLIGFVLRILVKRMKDFLDLENSFHIWILKEGKSRFSFRNKELGEEISRLHLLLILLAIGKTKLSIYSNVLSLDCLLYLPTFVSSYKAIYNIK